MQDIVELERRIGFALSRIGEGLGRLPDAMNRRIEDAIAAKKAEGPAPADSLDPPGASASVEAHKAVILRLRARLDAARESEEELRAQYEERIAALTEKLEQQANDLLRLRRASADLRHEITELREAQIAGLSDPDLIDQAMRSELAAIQAERLAEIAELEDLNSALELHLTGAENA